MKKKFYLTTSIPYANQPPHIGFALELLYADVMARYMRAQGEDVWFLTGTDEHGQKIARVAKEHNMSPQKWTDTIAKRVRELTKAWNITNDDFIRTTEARHEPGAQAFWRAAMKSGDLYKKSYTALYCDGCEAFKTEKDLVDGKCLDHQKALEPIEEENYFFKLSKYQKPIQKLFKDQPDFVVPESRRNEMANILKEGLEDISVSRSRKNLSWGIPVPDDDSQVMYVWFDALTNYVTALGYASADESKLKNYWPADAHVIGKDINRFHSLLWPAMLMSAGLDVPKKIAVHGWITVNGQKMSKTIGNVIDPFELVKKYPVDAVRYFFLREIPFDSDGDFSYKRFEERYNSDLAHDLGNLVMRVTTLFEKTEQKELVITPFVAQDTVDIHYHDAIKAFRYHEALEFVWTLVCEANKRLTDEKPWEALADKKSEKCIGELLFRMYQIGQLLQSFMPETAKKILNQIVFFETSDALMHISSKKGKPLFPALHVLS